MKRKLFSYFRLIILTLLLFPVFLFGQQWYYFEGFVTNVDDGSPLIEYPVFIVTGDLFADVTFTDNLGYYFDSLFMHNKENATVVVSTFDCMGKEQSFSYFNLDSLNHHNFEICAQESGCFAVFYAEAVQQDPFLIRFIDLSEGDIETWDWDFGDGHFSSEQNPMHLYDEAGFYEVCLTIETGADSCSSQYCDLIYVGQVECWADFEWETSTENPLEISFTDLSIGDIAFYDWDFGDGNFSEEQSPIHQYSEAGEYWVTLFVSDSMGICFDEIWQLVYVYDDSLNCKADFSFVLDTLNNTPYIFLFQDESEGNIEEWFWEFGDGHTSNEHYPQYAYQEGGIYEVCLSVSSSSINEGDCFDRICQTIETPDYFNFGGQVFIDGFTINIDSNDNANIAVAYLYRRVNNQWWYMDKREFWKYGYYWFSDKPEGEYLVRADLKDGSIDYDDYAPSYYKGSLNWQYANTFYLSNEEQFDVNIDLAKLSPFQSGIGSLSGYLQVGIGCSYSIQMENQLVQLFNAENQIIAFTYTDENGDFSFSGLGFGQYGLKAEFTGNSSTFFHTKLDADNSNVSDIELIIDCNGFVGMDENYAESSFTVESIFPVPAVDFVNLQLNSKENLEATIFIFDLSGRSVFMESVNFTQGRQNFKIPVLSLKSGLYLLRLISVDGNSVINQKIIISN